VSVFLAVDPGEVRIGLAVSDPGGSIARPLLVFTHVSRAEDAARIVRTAEEHQAELIVIGLALDSEGLVGHQARKAQRLAAAVEEAGSIPVQLVDESGTTQAALRRGRKDARIDARAAAYLLQEYLDGLKT